MAYLCHTNYKHEVNNSTEVSLPYDEILNVFHDLFDEYKLIGKKYKLLKKKHASLVSEFDKLRNEHDDSMLAPCTKCEELDLVKNENVLLKQMLEKIKIGSK